MLYTAQSQCLTVLIPVSADVSWHERLFLPEMTKESFVFKKALVKRETRWRDLNQGLLDEKEHTTA